MRLIWVLFSWLWPGCLEPVPAMLKYSLFCSKFSLLVSPCAGSVSQPTMDTEQWTEFPPTCSLATEKNANFQHQIEAIILVFELLLEITFIFTFNFSEQGSGRSLSTINHRGLLYMIWDKNVKLIQKEERTSVIYSWITKKTGSECYLSELWSNLKYWAAVTR